MLHGCLHIVRTRCTSRDWLHVARQRRRYHGAQGRPLVWLSSLPSLASFPAPEPQPTAVQPETPIKPGCGCGPLAGYRRAEDRHRAGAASSKQVDSSLTRRLCSSLSISTRDFPDEPRPSAAASATSAFALRMRAFDRRNFMFSPCRFRGRSPHSQPLSPPSSRLSFCVLDSRSCPRTCSAIRLL